MNLRPKGHSNLKSTLSEFESRNALRHGTVLSCLLKVAVLVISRTWCGKLFHEQCSA